MAKKNLKVDDFISNTKSWQKEYKELRRILLSCNLDEEFKWYKPCYATDGNNIVIVQGFKDFCALLFFKGVLMKDTKGLLESQGENTQSALRMTFTTVKEVKDKEKSIKDFVKQAVELEKSGAKVKFKEPKQFDVPEELASAFKKDAKFKKAFEALTPGRQRAYLMHFTGAKQSETRSSRIEKCKSKIFAGKGLIDR
ncbi:MAG: YdeI/OmpD-associated family protein [Acidimicrobiia bacterium]